MAQFPAIPAQKEQKVLSELSQISFIPIPISLISPLIILISHLIILISHLISLSIGIIGADKLWPLPKGRAKSTLRFFPLHEFVHTGSGVS